MNFAISLGAIKEAALCQTKERLLHLSYKEGLITVEMGEVIPYGWENALKLVINQLPAAINQLQALNLQESQHQRV